MMILIAGVPDHDDVPDGDVLDVGVPSLNHSTARDATVRQIFANLAR